MCPIAAAPQAALAPVPELEVWRVRVDHAPAALDEGLRLLDDGERQRAARFRHAADRARYVLGRATLRRLLCSRLHARNATLVFTANEFGKPVLLAPGTELQFNSSHSGEWILHAFHTRAPVGVDVEQVRADFADPADFTSALTPEEAVWIASVPQPDRPAALARIWVRMEAYLKALGQGVSRSPAHIRIEAGPAGRPRLSYDRNDPRTADAWSFQDIPLDEDHVACVAWRSGNGETACATAAVIRDMGL
jgi:4'-phosphopantetheinyl transferase